MTPKYKIGDEVQSLSDPSRIGTVVAIADVHAGIQYYRVNFGAAGRPIIGEIDLRSFEPGDTPAQNLTKGQIDGYKEFQRLITYQRLLRDYPLRNNIYAFNASRTRFYPYQFKPLLKFLDSPKHRLLIADEVGLGKTIEAGLILTELNARQSVQRVLIVCPSNLKEKWQMEMKRRFGEDFDILNAQRFMQFLEAYDVSPYETVNGIISLESIRQQHVLETLDALSPNFDLVIVDEAHHMRNFGRKQRKAGELLSGNADAMLLLTATPIHLGNENLFSLLNILDEEEFPDFYTVEDRFKSNEPIVHAQICMGHIPPNLEEAKEFIRSLTNAPLVANDPLYKEISVKLERLEHDSLSKDQKRRIILDVQRELAELNLIGHIFNRTKKREVHSSLAQRRADPLRIKLTEIERQFYDVVTDYVRNESGRKNGISYIERFILHMPQRRMASSIPAMVQHYREHFGFSPNDFPEDFDILDESTDDLNQGDFEFLSAQERLQAIIKRWPSDGEDSKYNMFISILKDLKESARKDGKSIKVMVFAFFKGTLRYLNKRLQEDGFKSALISGDVHPQERLKIVKQFREDRRYEILLSSKVGSEGLDFQFCNTLFNYDLPWNPMEVEQRIGRLDRIGQEAPIIHIYNFWIENTIEQRIMDRLYLRIGIFERSIGELEMILGDELSTLERDILSQKLTPEEEEELIERKIRIIERRAKDLNNLEKKAAEFIGTDQFFDEEVKMIKQQRRYITGEQMRRYLVDFIKTHCPRTKLDYNLDKNLGTFNPDQKFQSLLTKHDRAGELLRFLNLIGGEISITFDSQTAFENPNIEFINVLHPITQAIANYYKEESAIKSNVHHVVLKTEILPCGLYLHFIFRLRVRAARSRNTLEMILLDLNLNSPLPTEEIETLFGEMVEKGEDSRGGGYQIDQDWAVQACAKAERSFLERVADIREVTIRTNDAFIERRLESLERSFGKKIKNKQVQLEKGEREVKKGHYLRMLRNTIRNLEFQLREKRQDLESLRSIEVEYDEISAGILEVI